MTTFAQIEDFKQRTQLALDRQSSYMVKGSDDHLDMLLDLKGPIDSYIETFSRINDELLRSITPENVHEFNGEQINSLKEILEYSDRLLTYMRGLDLHDDLKNCYEDYEAEVLQLRESIMDIESFITNSDSTHRLNSLLADL